MDKSLLLVVIFLGAFSLFKAAMLIMVGMAMKPKVDEDGNIVKPVEEEDEEKQPSINEDDRSSGRFFHELKSGCNCIQLTFYAILRQLKKVSDKMHVCEIFQNLFNYAVRKK